MRPECNYSGVVSGLPKHILVVYGGGVLIVKKVLAPGGGYWVYTIPPSPQVPEILIDIFTGKGLTLRGAGNCLMGDAKPKAGG